MSKEGEVFCHNIEKFNSEARDALLLSFNKKDPVPPVIKEVQIVTLGVKGIRILDPFVKASGRR